jgi:hypothetical protein
MSEEFKGKTAQEILIFKGHAELADLMTLLADLPEVKSIIDATERAGGDSDLIAAFKGGLLMGFSLGTNYASTGKLT